MLEAIARLLGADYCKTWLTIMPNADYPRYWPEEGARIPHAGDQVLFGIALTVAGNWAHGHPHGLHRACDTCSNQTVAVRC
jgi:hypothetical protein